MALFFAGMCAQAFITALLTRFELITPSFQQQLMASIILLVIAILNTRG